MPELRWIGKDAVVKHHKEVPFKLIEPVPELSCGDADNGNLIVEGDNLLALKALLPRYAGKVKCIYIDPPYNTGNEGWAYNDNVNSPEIRKWLGEVVGKEGETLDRHDRWLCMMYPRLVLLREFLRDDGIIFVSIDDNEVTHLRILLTEIFGAQNFVHEIVWKNKYGPGAMTKAFGNVHEYILAFSRNPLTSVEAQLSDDAANSYKSRDDKYELRGGYVTQPLMTRSKDPRPNLVYPVIYEGEEIWPDKQWIWEKRRLQAAIDANEVIFRKTNGKWSVRFKQYLRDEFGQVRMAKPISILNGPFNQEGTWELESIFGTKELFSNPKPRSLVAYLTSMVINGKEDKDYIVMDSFAGSGTTGHAVLKQNAEDGGNRKFILVEMDPKIAPNVTAERVRRVAEGYTNAKGEQVAGLGGGFQYCRLSQEPLFLADGSIRPTVTFAELAEFVWFMETGTGRMRDAESGMRNKEASALLGVNGDKAVFLLYNGILKDKSDIGGNVLNGRTLEVIDSLLPEHDGERVVYGARTRFDKKKLASLGITFHQLPYDLATKTWF
jgi:DNA modification methylase